MGIFKKKMSKDDILAAINALSEDEQLDLFEELVDSLENEEDMSNETVEQDDDGAQESGAQIGDVRNRLEESVEEQKADKSKIRDSESGRVESEDNQEVNAALGARISALEEQITDLEERLEQMLSSFENQDFGANHGGGAEKPATEDDEAYMDVYYAKQKRRK